MIKKGIIIEGIDCGGKSTLVKTLKSKLKKYGGFDVKELEHKDEYNQFRRYLYEYAISQKIIFDRSHISEIVYGKILRNNIPFSETQLLVLNTIVSIDYILIYAKPSFSDFKKRMVETKKYQVISLSDYEKIIDNYDKVISNFDFIPYSSSSFEELESTSNNILNLLYNNYQKGMNH